jgi:hypothetical protein
LWTLLLTDNWRCWRVDTLLLGQQVGLTLRE